MDHLREALLHACNPFPQMVAQGLPICSQLLYKKSNLQRLRQPPLENPREMEEKVEHLSSVHEKKVFSFQQLVFPNSHLKMVCLFYSEITLTLRTTKKTRKGGGSHVTLT